LPDCHARITKAYFASKNAGSQEIMIVVEADDNYTLDDGTTSQTLKYPRGGIITLRQLTLNGDAQVAPKVYDGTTGIEIKSITLPTIDGIIDGDDVSLRTVFAEADDAAPGERIATISLSILGSDAKNYTLGTASQITAPVVIKPRQKHNVSIVLRGDTTALQYGYATIGATPSNTVFFDVEPLISGTAYINGVDAGMKLPAGLNTLQLKFVPQDTMTYAVAETSVSLRVAPHPVSFSGTFSAVGKTYDGTTDVDESSLTLPQIEGAFDGDDVSLSIKNAFFSTKSAGENTVYANFELTGKDALNYTASTEDLTADAKAEITPRPVTLSGSLIAQNKVYDGTTDVDAKTLTLPNIEGAISGDDVSLSIKNAFFDTKSAGENTVFANFELTGNDALNYTASPEELTADAKAEILPKPLTANPSAAEIRPRLYDGTTSVADSQIVALPTVDGIVGSDDVTTSWTAEYESAEVGRHNILLTCGLAGHDAANYMAPDVVAIMGEILAREAQPSPIVASLSSAYVMRSCGENAASLSVIMTSGTPSTYNIAFDDDALAAGFVDVVNQPLPKGEDGVVGIDIATPQDDIVGVVGGSLSLADADGTRGEAIAFVISLRPSASTIGIKFGNTLFVDNSTNLFTAYQWYADGREIPSATRQFYHASPLPAAQYSVRLTMTDGDTLSTCPYTLDLPSTSAASGLSVSPNPAPRGAEVRVFVDGMEYGTRICVEFYDASGSLCESRNVGNGETISISLRQGIYAVRAKTEGVDCGETKIAVK
ncbi:MAG: YDG domain-containing protein, partial [Bacteroidales bacterium]|nr:YDG domain-containing protein [Bacteroidales bacterium]